MRNIRKNKVFSFINIFGLAIGLCSFMFIAAFVYSELNYDTFPKESENIYRIGLNVTGNGEVAVYPQVDVAVGNGMKDAFPEIKASTRLVPFTEYLKYEDKQFKEEHIAFADSNFLQIFSIKLLEGNQATALEQPNSIVISKDFGKKYFGNNISPYGKYLMVGTYGKLCKITGVYDKIPDNAHFHFDAFLSINGEPFANRKTWTNIGFYTYLLLNKNSDAKKLEAKFPQLVEKYVVPETQQDMGVSLAEARKSINDFTFTLEPLNRIHLYSHTKYELEANGDIQYVYIFSALALFILLLAGINFTNLSTVKAVKRSREVGIRKVLGSLKRQLVTQFLSESVIITIFALLCAYGFALLLLPSFNQVANKHFTYHNFINFPFIVGMLVLCFFTGILAGIYPAFFLSSFNTIKVLKGNSGQSAKKSFLRSGLVVFQFFISISLIIATIIVYQQLHFMQNKKLGFEQDQVIYLPDTDLLGDNQDAFEQQISRDSRIVSSTISWAIPGNPLMNGTEIFPKNDGGNGKTI
ncbi:MAG: ABC transporter permease, partial [Ginsengibacter sp.]